MNRQRAWPVAMPTDGVVNVAPFGSDWTALKAAWDFAKALGAIFVRGAAGATYTLTDVADKLTATDEEIHLDLSQSTLRVGVNAPEFLRVVGTWSDIVNISAIAGSAFTVSSASAYSELDVIKIVDEQVLTHYPTGGQQGEFAIVTDITGNVVTTVGNPRYTYDTGQTPRMGRLGMNPCVIKIGKIEYPNSFSGSGQIMWIEARNAPVLRVTEQDLTKGAVCRFVSCWGGDGKINSLQVFDPNGSNGYGLVLNSTEYATMQVTRSGMIRHAVDAGSSGGMGSDLSSYGECYGCTGRNSVNFGATEAPFATHHGTWNFTFDNCHSYNANGGVSFRGVNNLGRNCSTTGATVGSFSCFKQSGAEHVSSVTSGTRFQGCSVNGGLVNFGGTSWGDITFINCRFEVAAGATINGLWDVTDGSMTFENVTLVAYGSPVVRIINGQTGCTGVSIYNSKFLFPGGLVPSVMVDDPALVGFPCVIDGLYIENPGDTIAAIFGNGAVLAAGSRFGGITVVGSLTALVEGFTLAQTQPYTFGPVTANKRLIANALPSYAIVSDLPTVGIGYSTGAGGTNNQITSKATGVLLNKICGQVTMNNANLAAGASVSFTLTNSAVAATDYMQIKHVSGGTLGSYSVRAVEGAGSATVTVTNTSGGDLAEAIVLKFVVVKAVTA